jgi:hypothetical protein
LPLATVSSAAIGTALAAVTSAISWRVATGGELDLERLDHAQDPERLADAPGAVRVDPDSRSRADRGAHRPHLRDVLAAAELELECLEATLGPAPRVGRHLGGWARDQCRIAAHGRHRVGAEQPPDGLPRGLAREIQDRHLERGARGTRQAPTGGDVDVGVDRRPQRLGPGEVREVRASQAAGRASQGAGDVRQARAAAQGERHRLAQSLERAVRAQANEEHLPGAQRAARGRVRPLERERVRDQLHLGDLHGGLRRARSRGRRRAGG